MLTLTASESGDKYLKNEKLSLLRCIQYDIKDDDTTIGTFLSGYRHSGEEYFSFTVNDEDFSIALKRISFSKKQYQIHRNQFVALIGDIQYPNWPFVSRGGGTLQLLNSELYHFSELFGIIAALQHNRRKFNLRSNSGSVIYAGEFSAGDGSKSTFSGSIEPEGMFQVETIFSGLFFLDKKFRRWISKNVD